MKTAKFDRHVFELGKFRPCLVYNIGLGCLSVRLRDCSYTEVMITQPFDILRENHFGKRQGEFVGFTMWGVRGMLHDQGYTKTSISLENLIKRFRRHYMLPYKANVFGKYEEKILEIAREHQFVWWIPR